MMQPVFRPKQPECGLYLCLLIYKTLYDTSAKQTVYHTVRYFLCAAPASGW